MCVSVCLSVSLDDFVCICSIILLYYICTVNIIFGFAVFKLNNSKKSFKKENLWIHFHDQLPVTYNNCIHLWLLSLCLYIPPIPFVVRKAFSLSTICYVCGAGSRDKSVKIRENKQIIRALIHSFMRTFWTDVIKPCWLITSICEKMKENMIIIRFIWSLFSLCSYIFVEFRPLHCEFSCHFPATFFFF